MFRSHNLGELTLSDVNKEVTLCGWVYKTRDLGGMTFVDLRDRYGITQLAFNLETNKELCLNARSLGREYVIQISGKVIERSSKNPNIPTGEIEIDVDQLNILNKSKTPPFTIENDTDGGDEIRMKYRYLDIRRDKIKENLLLRNKLSLETRKYLNSIDFVEVETPYLIKSTPEGARDFIVPSRMNSGQFYALPQSPQTFKQLLMVGGMDKYYQIVKCFRDEDLRADRQPEFTQIDCEMSFVSESDVLEQFEGLILHLLKKFGKTVKAFPKLTYKDAIENYGTDKPDLRFDIKINEITDNVKGKDFNIFDKAEYIGCLVLNDKAELSRKEIDELTEWVKRPQVGANGILWIKNNADGSIKSSFDKFFTSDDLTSLTKDIGSKSGDLILIMAGTKKETLEHLGTLRVEIGKRYDFINFDLFCPAWVTDFPLFEYDEEEKKFKSMHHPFTSPNKESLGHLDSDPEKVIANAYDLVLNGNEIGGGSIRIHDYNTQMKIFEILGMSKKEYESQFGFLIEALKYGAPPHGGIAFGLDRLAAVLNNKDVIRDFIAFPKNNSGKDLMIDAPAKLTKEQLKDMGEE